MEYYETFKYFTKKFFKFFENLKHENIESFSEVAGNGYDIHMKSGLTAQIKFNEPGERGVYWSIEDFKSEAKGRYPRHLEDYPEAKTWEDVYDETKFEGALIRMIDKHDANYGISWTTVDFFLDEMCLKTNW